MKIKFKDGAVMECSAPIEQKLFKTVTGETVDAGWLLVIRLNGRITSASLDTLLSSDNLSHLEFFTEDENGDINSTFVLEGYCRLSAATIRHSENTENTTTEIQIQKGV